MRNMIEFMNVLKIRLAIVDEFAKQLMMSGYGRDQARRIITSGLVGYENMKDRAAAAGEGIHKSAASSAVARRRSRLLGRGNWFRSPPKNVTKDTSKPRQRSAKGFQARPKRKLPVSTLFCVQTRNGLLAKSLKQQERKLAEMTGETIKIIERSGVTVKQLLIRSNNWVQICANIKCAHCRTIENNYPSPQISNDNKKKTSNSDENKQPPVDCRLRGTGGHTYMSWCVECTIARKNQQEKLKLKIENKKQETIKEKESEGEVKEQEDDEEEDEIKEAVYLGESRRGPQLRSSDHWDDAKASKDQSHVFKHWKDCHANEPMPRFGARVIRFYKSSMLRQISESTLIWRWTKDKCHINLLNQKGMYNRCHLARLGTGGKCSERKD